MAGATAVLAGPVDRPSHPSGKVGRMGEVSLRLRDATVYPERQPDLPDAPASPPAARQRRSRWRDPKLWLGAVLVLGSIVVGARVLASADDTVAVWQVAHDVPAGSPVDGSDLRSTRAHFDDPAVAAQYVSATHALAPGVRATVDLHAGELLPAAEVSATAAPDIRQLPLGVSAAHAPADLRAGDHVEVWAVPGASAADGGSADHPVPRLVFRDVTVVSVGSSVLGASADRQVLIGLGPAVDVGTVLQQITGAGVVLVRLAG